jgi:hypothetical protein
LDSPEAQIDFMMTELQGPESGAARSIFAAQDPNQAAVAIARDFLRPAPENLQRRVASYGGGGGSGSASSGSNSGGGTMPMGLFDMQEQPPQTFGERLRAGMRSGSLIDSLALAANSLRDRPDQNIAQIVQGRQERRDEKATVNRTAAWLASQGRGDLAQAMLAGGLDPKSAVAAHMAAMAPADPLAAIELEKAQIELQNLQNPVAEFRTLTADEATAMGLPPGAYQIGADGKISTIGGGGTTINMPGQPTIGTVPPGYQAVKNQDGTYRYEVIPGGPAAVEIATAEGQKSNVAATAEDSMRLIDSVINDPALPSITGMLQGRMPPLTQAGTNLLAKVEQIQGQAFLQAFESLKGGGAITEREGLAAQNAVARLQRTQDQAAMIEGLKELNAVLDRGRRRALAGVQARDGDEYSGGNVINGVTVGEPIE